MRLVGADEKDLLGQSKKFALRIIRVYAALPKQLETQVIGKQLLRSGTSVGAHLAEASHGKSRPDFLSKIEGALQELQESKYWLELLIEGGFLSQTKLQSLVTECSELTAILATIAHKTSQKIRAKSKGL
jgi:four helix bundle protein